MRPEEKAQVRRMVVDLLVMIEERTRGHQRPMEPEPVMEYCPPELRYRRRRRGSS